MTEQEIANYIRSKNLDIRTVEQIVSFFFDYDKRYCGDLDWWDKKEVVRFIYGERFSEVWKTVIDEFEKRKKARNNG